MRKKNQVIAILLLMSLLTMLISCGKNEGNIQAGSLPETNTPAFSNLLIDNESEHSFIENNEIFATYINGFVDERFELISLVFRLAGRSEYNETSTDYQRRIDSIFNEYRQHPVVTYTIQNLHF
ncbi:MAG: DUF4932 domain-containing protein [Oscillospiraceae bacterium]|nr:DUF4932 domain-containing protein [Oscillospiraceae bacterium]